MTKVALLAGAYFLPSAGSHSGGGRGLAWLAFVAVVAYVGYRLKK